MQNRAGVRALLACLLAKVHDPEVDIRKPYTEIGGPDSYSGRTYDERFITQFVVRYRLPCNPTTAFLTPAFRNRNIVLTPEVNLVGRPPAVYEAFLQLLADVYEGRVIAEDLLAETIRNLIIYRDEREGRMRELREGLRGVGEGIPLSSEGILALIEQHLRFQRRGARGSSRLPVLVVAAAYQAASNKLGEQVLPLESHNAADLQTGSLGDLEITLLSEDNVATSYEMKTRRVSVDDINHAVQKIHQTGKQPDNYIFITTDTIDPDVQDYAISQYDEIGIEFVILDCIGFLRHFLHLFHRIRTHFLDAYQQFLLTEPDSAVSQPIKEAFLAMRQAVESGE